MEKPHVLSLATLVDAMGSDPQKKATTFYSREGLAVAFGMSGVMRKFLRPQSPYLIEDYRCGVVLSGSLYGRINLIEHHITAGMVVYISPGSFVEPIDISDDFHLNGIGMTREVFHIVNRYNIPKIFNGQTKDGCRSLNDKEIGFVREMFNTLWGMLKSERSSKETQYSMVSAVINHVNDLFSSQEPSQSIRRSTANTLFDNFIYLVNLNARQHRQLNFYADKMCITERYLGSIVKKVSGVTAKEWIDRAVITAAKVMLRHSCRQVSSIADELNFPNTSFFCKYFKRLAGCTPQEFRDVESVKRID